MNKKILLLLIIFLAPNHNFSSEINIDEKIKMLEQAIEENNNAHPYLIEYIKEKERLIAFKQQLGDFIASKETEINFEYSYQVKNKDSNFCSESITSSVHIEISKSEIAQAFNEAKVEKLIQKIDLAIRQIDKAIKRFKKAYLALVDCILQNQENCIDTFSRQFKDLSISYSYYLAGPKSREIDKVKPALTLAGKRVFLERRLKELKAIKYKNEKLKEIENLKTEIDKLKSKTENL